MGEGFSVGVLSFAFRFQVSGGMDWRATRKALALTCRSSRRGKQNLSFPRSKVWMQPHKNLANVVAYASSVSSFPTHFHFALVLKTDVKGWSETFVVAKAPLFTLGTHLTSVA